MAYVSLFFSALIAATVFPAQSEMVLVYLVQQAAHPVWALVVVASIGNVLGSVINYALGYSVHRFKDRRWFPASPKQMDRAQAFYAKWGRYSLLASWVPIIGDPITVVAGVLRDRFLVFLILVAIAKSGRYVVLVYVFA